MQAIRSRKEIDAGLDRFYPDSPETPLRMAELSIKHLLERWHRRGIWRGHHADKTYSLKPGTYRAEVKEWRYEIRYYKRKIDRLNKAGNRRGPMTLEEFKQYVNSK